MGLLNKIAQYKEMIGEKHAQFFPNIIQEALNTLNANLVPVETLYTSISALDGVYAEDQYNNLKKGLTAIRKAELDDMLASGEITQANYDYLYYGLLHSMETGLPIDISKYGAIDLSKFFGIHEPSLLIELGAAHADDADFIFNTCHIICPPLRGSLSRNMYGRRRR